MKDIAGRTAFITGGANGIGLGIARQLAAAGVKLGLADLDSEALARAEAELGEQVAVTTAVLDVRDRVAYARAADAVEDTIGPVSLLFNNAGVSGAFPVAKLTYAMWDWVLGINLYGVINGIQTFLPRMITRGDGGYIVNTASGAGLAATASGTLYCTSKFGVVGLSEALHHELAAANIGVSVLCPGPVATDLLKRSADARPAADLSAEERAQAADRVEMMSDFLKQGVPPDKVGQMVLSAMCENRLFIHTDRIMAEAVIARTKAILAAVPAA
jgi:NAD(P)-dependent dehydrogenase (short-subunit alcohol dehydrogenase family)